MYGMEDAIHDLETENIELTTRITELEAENKELDGINERLVERITATEFECQTWRERAEKAEKIVKAITIEVKHQSQGGLGNVAFRVNVESIINGDDDEA